MSFARHADKACRFFSHADQSDFPTGGPHFDSIQPRPGETKMRVTWARARSNKLTPIRL
jgi:hypothetical protein